MSDDYKPDKLRTERGFRIFAECEIKVIESSLAFEGAHVWIQGGRPINNDGDVGAVQVNVAQAKEIVAGLLIFIEEAEHDELTEPAGPPELDKENRAPVDDL